jgi:DNA repair exonuclease SbcCD nuclease subunit
MAKQVKYLTISDVHLGHKRNTTLEIIKNLNIYFDDYKPTSQFTDLDILFIAGDLFDTLLDNEGSGEVHEILIWLDRLMRFCGKHSIKLRILEGTPSHDWRQSKLAATLHHINAHDTCLDFRYIETAYIEFLKDLELYILYVPDEFSPSPDMTLSHVESLMKDLNITQVDIACMHGAFSWQLRNAPSHIQRHSEEAYLSIVKHYVNIGHVHNFSTYDRLLAQGSFDRLSHGEEEPKGGILCDIRGPHGDSFNFIENVGAKIFKTITLRTLDLDKCIQQISKATLKIPDDSYVRIKAVKTHPIYVAFDELKIKFPMFHLSKISLDDEDISEPKESLIVDTDVYTPVSITDTNIVDLLMNEVRSKYNLSDSQLTLLTGLLEQTNVK